MYKDYLLSLRNMPHLFPKLLENFIYQLTHAFNFLIYFLIIQKVSTLGKITTIGSSARKADEAIHR